jgi:hypothetical protein
VKPKFTDKRYPHGYTPSHSTDIRKTFQRIRKQREEAARVVVANIKPQKVANGR